MTLASVIDGEINPKTAAQGTTFHKSIQCNRLPGEKQSSIDEIPGIASPAEAE
jgi:hypothetical protein